MRTETARVLVVTDDEAQAVKLRALLAEHLPEAALVLALEGVFDGGELAAADPERLAAKLREALRAASSDSKRGERSRPLVLVVEDDEFSHQLVSSMLVNENLELVFEADGAAAIDRIRALEPDLVLMDINLPGVDGVAITQRLKAEPELAVIPVVMLTGEARRETLIRSVEAGAADFIVKPFSREALIAKIARYVPGFG